MALNPQIALNVQTPDIGGGIMRLAQVKRQKEAEQASAETQQIQTQAAQQQIQAGNMELDRAHLEESILQAAQVHPLLEAGDYQGAKTVMMQQRQQLASRGGNTADLDEALQAVDQNPQELTKATRSMVGLGQQMGIVQAPKEAEGFTLSEGQTRFDAQGNPVASSQKGPQTNMGKASFDYRNGDISEKEYKTIIQNESGLKSPEQIDQLMQIERQKAIISRDDEVRRRELEKLDLGIEAERQKMAKGGRDAEKAAGLKDEAKRLVKELLDNRDGVTSYVGPVDSMLDTTFGEKTTKARTNINQLLSILTAENLGLMSGVLSETDVKIIQRIAGGGLDIMGDEDNFMSELERLGTTLGAGESQNLPAGVRSIKKVQ